MIGLLLLASSLTWPAAAQDTETETDTLHLERGSFTLRVEDGKVFLNGQEVDDGTTIIVMEDDGERRIMRLRGAPPLPDVIDVWRRRAPEGDVKVFLERMERYTPDELRFFYGLPDQKDLVFRDEEEREVGPLHGFDGPGRQEFRFFHGLPDEDDVDVVLEAPGRVRDEEVIRMEREAERMARALRRAEGEDRKRQEEALRQKLEEIFERKMQLSEERLNELQEALKEARKQLEARRRARSEIIERRLKELLGERDLFAW